MWGAVTAALPGGGRDGGCVTARQRQDTDRNEEEDMSCNSTIVIRLSHITIKMCWSHTKEPKTTNWVGAEDLAKTVSSCENQEEEAIS